MFCPICGKDNPENTAFCENCGHPMHRPSAVPQPQVTEPQVLPPRPVGEVPGKVLGIVGMILGIVSIAFGCCAPIFPTICAIVGLILSIVSMRKAKEVQRKNGFSLAGLICSIVGLVFSLFYCLIFALLIMAEYA